MLGTISHNHVGTDMDSLLCESELRALGVGDTVLGLLLVQSPIERILKDLRFGFDNDISRISFDETNDFMDIRLPKSLLDTLVCEKSLSERCEYGMIDGTKMNIKMLGGLEHRLIDGASLPIAGIDLAKQKGLQQGDEQGLVEGLFSGITDVERKIVREILNP